MFSAVSVDSIADTLLIDQGFENLTGQSGDYAPAEDYPFGSNYLSYWQRHDAGTDIISNCEGRLAADGSNYLHLQFSPGAADPCLAQLSTYPNSYMQMGLDFEFPKGNQNRTVFSESFSTNTMVVRFAFRLTGDWTVANDDADNGGGLKFIRVTGTGRSGDTSAALIKLRLDGDDPSPRWTIYDPSNYRTHYFNPELNIKDGNWHTISYKVEINDPNGSSGNITTTFWLDDWNMSGAGYTQTITAPTFGNTFFTAAMFENWSGNVPNNAMGIDLDNLEVWDGLPESTPISHKYTILNPSLDSSEVISLIDNNVITAGSTTLNLDRYESGAFHSNTGALTQGAVVTGSGPFEMGSRISATDLPAHASLAGRLFVMPHVRYSHKYFMVSPYDDTVAHVNVDGLQYDVTLPQGVVMDFDAGKTNGNVSAVITSNSPILVSHRGESVDGGLTDASPVPPATYNLWGILSQNTYIGAAEDNTNVMIYTSNEISRSLTLNAGEKQAVEVGLNDPQGRGSAIHLIANKPIGAVQIADGDGQEQTAFFPTYLLSTRFGIPINAQYIAVVCPEENTSVTLYNGDNAPVTRRCSANRRYPGKAFFGSGENGSVGAQQGAYLESDKPIHVIYEASNSQDEHNLMGTQMP
jgi:hypothetical protein